VISRILCSHELPHLGNDEPLITWPIVIEGSASGTPVTLPPGRLISTVLQCPQQ
jgi:hypothetical protein